VNLLEKIDDLIVQATTERSHYYTASVLREAASTIRALVAELERLRAERDHHQKTEIAAEAKLREAVEVIQHIYDFGLDRLKVERFLATMEEPHD
jgi:hypothetical protein